jgi:protein-S-isoprenylcysteine O-methyltransferase Ste14
MLESSSAARTVMVLAGTLGWLSLLAFMVFLFIGSLNVVDLGLDTAGTLSLDAGLCLLFFIQHSVMVRKSFRRWLARSTPDAYVSAIYAICSSLVLLAVVIFWQRSASALIEPNGVYRIPFHAVFLLSLVGFVWGVRALKSFDPFGITPIRHHLQGTEPKPERFIVAGPYRWVRHPLYLFMILIIWACPDLTLDRLLFNLLWTTWIVTVGTIMEERDLVAEFGNIYREYQRKVPMLIPFRLPPPIQDPVGSDQDSGSR